MEKQNTPIMQVIENEQALFVKYTECKNNALSDWEKAFYERMRTDSRDRIYSITKLLPVEREVLISAYETGMLQANNIGTDHEDDCKCEECILQSESMAKDYFIQTFKTQGDE